MNPHPQADILRAIADGKTIEASHPRWNHGAWMTNCSPLTVIGSPDWRLRVKPETININNIVICAPERAPLEQWMTYYIPNLINNGRYDIFHWTGSDENIRHLALGLVHLSADNAIAHTKAMLSFTRSDK